MDTPSKSNDTELHKDLENWMTNLPQNLKKIPLIHLAIPGSHDSMTSSITSKSKLAPDAEPVLQNLKFLGPLLRFVVSRWSKTQVYDVTYQLKSGIRYFDLRIATQDGTSDLYFVHGLYSSDVVLSLNEIKEFLETHPEEVVILDCQHFYAFDDSNHEKLMSALTVTFGPKLLPYTPQMNHLTLEYMTTKFRYQVVAIYRSDAARFGQPLLWPSVSFPTPWPNTVSITKLISSLEENLANRPASVGFVSQCVLTPTPMFICKNIFSTLKSRCVIPLEKKKTQWLQKQSPGLGGINIVICDFIDMIDCQFTKEVIGLNAKLLSLSAESTTSRSSITERDNI